MVSEYIEEIVYCIYEMLGTDYLEKRYRKEKFPSTDLGHFTNSHTLQQISEASMCFFVVALVESLFALRAVYPFNRKAKFSAKLHAKSFNCCRELCYFNKRHFWFKCKVIIFIVRRQTVLFSATQTRNVEDLARVSLKESPLYVKSEDDTGISTVSGLEQVPLNSPLVLKAK